MRRWTAAIIAAALLVPGPSFAATVAAAIPSVPAAPYAFTGVTASAAPLAPVFAPAALGSLTPAAQPIFAAPFAAAAPAAAAPAALAAAPAAASDPHSSPQAQVRAAESAAAAPDSTSGLREIYDGAEASPASAVAAPPAATNRGGGLTKAASRSAAAVVLFATNALAQAAPHAPAVHPSFWHSDSAVLLAVFAAIVGTAAVASVVVRKIREHFAAKNPEEPKLAFKGFSGSSSNILGLSDPPKNAPASTVPEKPRKKVSMADVAGQDEAKAELENIIDFIKHKDAYQAVNPDVEGPKGALLIGPPGTGKTLLARAMADEAGVPFQSTKGSDFINQFVGTGAKGIRDQMAELKAKANGGPAIFFIDEIDSIGMHRSGDANNAEETRTLNALLTLMDGFEKDDIIFLASTNRPDMLDPALLRGGRFGLKITVGLPDVVGREAVLKVHTKNMAMTEDVSIPDLAKQTPGLAGADLKEIVNDVTMTVGNRRDKKASMADFLKAVDRFTTGHERRKVMREDEKIAVSYHEAGHALVSMLLPDADPVRKVTNIPHGLQALGFMQALPEQERMMYSREWLIDRMAVGLGGRVAEKMMTGKIWSGAGNDLMNVTKIARMMVMNYGMSEAVGLVSYDVDGEPVQAGKPLSEETKILIDKEVRLMVDEAQSRAEQVLTAYRSTLKAMGDELMVKETLRENELEAFVPKGTKFHPSPEKP
ncbi:MAG: ATP-dependent metallopeptidase FtsH/Yme1/Tma family protein [Elusimicrobiota bacterium]